jgi:hypothetical protein
MPLRTTGILNNALHAVFSFCFVLEIDLGGREDGYWTGKAFYG